MAKIRTVNLPWTTVSTKSTSTTFYPATGWMPAGGVEQARANVELTGRTNDLVITLGYQTADVIDDPKTPVALANASRNADGIAFGSDFEDVASGTDGTKGKQLIRWGFMFKNDTSTDPSNGRVTGMLQVQVCG